MPIPLEQGQSQKDAKDIARLQRKQTGKVKDIRRLLCKALVHAVEADNGNEDAREDMLSLLDASIERGMSSTAIRAGAGMVGKIRKLLDRPASQAHALGLLLNAADMVAELDPVKAAEIRAIADTMDNTQNHAEWQAIATPQIRL